MQQGFVTPETEATVPRILDFLGRERQRYVAVIATRFVNHRGSLYETERDWHLMMPSPSTCIVPDVEGAADLVVDKHGLAPDPADLLPLLHRLRVRRVELCGFDTDQCVLATALLLWDAGIPPRVLADLCSSSGGPDMHQAGLAITRRSIGDRNVTDTAGRPV